MPKKLFFKEIQENDKVKKLVYSEMNPLGNIVDSVINNSSLKNGLKKATLLKFWSKAAGKKFEKVSEISNLMQKPDGKYILSVACANSSVTAELTMFKSQLIKKMNTFAVPLGIEIEDINFSHKIWQSKEEKINEDKFKLLDENPYKENLTGFSPEEISLDEDELNEIKNNIEKNSVLSPEQKKRFFNSIVNDLKVQKFLNKN